jgi:hypothetical protein
VSGRGPRHEGRVEHLREIDHRHGGRARVDDDGHRVAAVRALVGRHALGLEVREERQVARHIVPGRGDAAAGRRRQCEGEEVVVAVLRSREDRRMGSLPPPPRPPEQRAQTAAPVS